MLFTEFGLKQGLLKGLEEMKYTQPTPIQEKVIRIVLSGKNIIGQSQTGTGKTAAFLIPILNKIDTNKTSLQVLIIAPTRELVHQIGEEIRSLTKYYRVRTACVFGGASMLHQTTEIKRSPSIIVATPGRLMDFMKQGLIKLNTVEYFVLDEVDRMLDMGFVRDITSIRSTMKNIKQTLTFSATLSNEVKKIINDHVSEYESIKIGETITVDKINHSYMELAHDDKFITCKQLIDSHPQDKILIFTHTKRNTKTIHKVLEIEGYKVGLLNGDMKQSKRMSTLEAFKDQKIRIMITTDVAARGLNMNNVGLVINFDVPQDAESYIHRIGRTGRAGASGKAIMLVSKEEKNLLANIEKVNKTRIKKSLDLPTLDTGGDYSRVKLSKVKIKGERRPAPPARKSTSPGSRFESPTPSKISGRPRYGESPAPSKVSGRPRYGESPAPSKVSGRPRYGERREAPRDGAQTTKNKNFHNRRFHKG